MKLSIERIIAISLAIAFALLSSVVLAGIVWQFGGPDTISERSSSNSRRWFDGSPAGGSGSARSSTAAWSSPCS
ncbi:MAG: hypothetical protein ABEN55_01465, partial [Bradymonadaceae bacterium]